MVDDDFPFYNGRPALVTGGRWWIVLLGVLLGFAALIALPVPGLLGVWTRAILFVAIPLVVYARVVPGHWTAIFRRLRFRDLGTMVLFALLNLVIMLVLGVLLLHAAGLAANPLGDDLAKMPTGERILTFLAMVPQLFGEELFSVLPFLALLYWLHHRLALSRSTAVVVAWLATAVIFGVAHLPTYDWNLVQCFVIIGTARLVLLLAYFRTKNILVAAGAHILNDWAMFGLALA
ncbi:CPBP family intramembrane glutamic endopeptidase [Actinophytocola gossypii]|uniref:CPBP family intramembrane metalloprotease n=1 Tax=Actinophytocola gossypii TaxID=2812003 RepID=A0ABT2JEY6_9PSEU|nr:CPBP family intramembrane glutamic endopeptidase [Actinophytocola gossypii]MCT2586440.1 CPBP family intramembrane metalloprotease [Actinophytocola gossypii]